MPLSEAAIRALKSTGKARRYADERGLYLEVSPSGAKLWRFKYRFEGREKRLALGIYPDVGLRDARDRREKARSELARGIDPGAVIKAQKQATGERKVNAFEVVAREFLARQTTVWVPGYTRTWQSRMERDVFPFLGARPLDSITAPDLLELLRRVERRAVETAHRILVHCGQVFRYGIATSRCTRDISADLRGALQPVRPKHLPAITDPNGFGKLLRSIHDYHATPAVSTALRLAPLVFVRPGELRQAKWADIDLERAEWSFVASKTRQPLIVPLSLQAVALLRELHPVTGTGKDAIYVFPGARSRKRPMSDAALLVALRAMEIPAEQMTVHGFRAAARTLLDEQLRYRPDLVEHQLAHAVRDPNGRAYNRTSYLEERREMMQRWADYCDKLRQPAVAQPAGNRAA